MLLSLVASANSANTLPLWKNRAKVTRRAKQGARQKSVRAILHLSPRVRIIVKADHPAAALLSCAGWLELLAETIVNSTFRKLHRLNLCIIAPFHNNVGPIGGRDVAVSAICS